MAKKIAVNTDKNKEKSVSGEETKENENKLDVVNRDTQFFKIQVYADRIHTFVTIQASLAFVLFSLLSIFYGLYYQGFFEVKPSMMLTGYVGIAIIIVVVLITVVSIVNNYIKNIQKISDMIETVNKGKSLPTLAELPKWKKDNDII
jgi:hypothetical protein